MAQIYNLFSMILLFQIEPESSTVTLLGTSQNKLCDKNVVHQAFLKWILQSHYSCTFLIMPKKCYCIGPGILISKRDLM